MDDVRVSKFLSLVLRHEPSRVGIALDPAGWVAVPVLLAALAENGWSVGRSDLERVVAADPKRRYTLDRSGDRIRANQGHSVPVDLGLISTAPPPELFHGTPVRNLPAIQKDGLLRQRRHHVHLSPDVGTAAAVGARRGAFAVLRVDAAAMHAAGYSFAVSANGVWLTDAVPARYLTRMDEFAPSTGVR